MSYQNNSKKHFYVNTLRLELGLVREWGLSTDAVYAFRSVSRWFSAELHLSTLKRCSDLSLGYTKRHKKRSPTN